MARTSLGTEPIEVTSMILENLHTDGDFHALAAFSNVCKHYHDIADRYLWREVPITAIIAHGLANTTPRPSQFCFEERAGCYDEANTPYVAGRYKELMVRVSGRFGSRLAHELM